MAVTNIKKMQALMKLESYKRGEFKSIEELEILSPQELNELQDFLVQQLALVAEVRSQI